MTSYQQKLDKFLVTPTMTWKEAAIIKNALERYLDDNLHALELLDVNSDYRETIQRIICEFENEMDEGIEIMQRVKAT